MGPRIQLVLQDQREPTRATHFMNPRLRQHSHREHRSDAEGSAHLDLPTELRVVDVAKSILDLHTVDTVVSLEHEIEIMIALSLGAPAVASSRQVPR